MSDHVQQLSVGIDKFRDVIEKFKNKSNIEIELKIGIFEGGIFKPGLNSKEFFQRVLDLLNSNKNWTSSNYTKTEDIISDNIRQTGKEKIIKTKIYQANFSYENTPFDFRITVSEEKPTKERVIKSKSIKRKKERYSFVHMDYQYDLTTVVSEINSTKNTTYEFEIELLNLDNDVSDVYRAHSALLKMRDIINCCEKILDESKIKLIGETSSLKT
tara:strand:- start:75 stop:719 length:645 start_codon:yes stop_codon:yes gene_type:complete